MSAAAHARGEGRVSAERKLLVGDRGERHAVQRRHAVRGDCSSVFGSRIADVRLEVPAGMAIRGAAHVPVARDLRKHGGSRDGCAPRVATDHGALLVADVAEAEAVHEADRLITRDALQSSTQRLQVRLVQAAGVDPAHATHDNRRLRCRPQHERVELLAARLRVLLGVVQTRQGAAIRKRELVEVEEDRRGDQRSREAATTSLVGAGDVAALEGAVEGEEATTGTRGAALRACRYGLGASR